VNGKPVEHGIYRRLYPGDRVRFKVSGGGGYGDPRTREPERVARDVAEGYVSVEGARKDYAVAVDAETSLLNREATARLRQA
jgi:N-methylhydantoinase B